MHVILNQKVTKCIELKLKNLRNFFLRRKKYCSKFTSVAGEEFMPVGPPLTYMS